LLTLQNHRIRIAGKAMEIDDWHRGLADPKTVAWWREPLARGDREGYLYRVPRPGRLPALLEIVPELTDAEYWHLVGGIWTDTEMPHVNRALWLTLFTSKRGNRDQVMDAEGRAAVDRLPDHIQIYRGAQLKHARGMSWTTGPDIAAWFATRWSATRFGFTGAKVFTTTVEKRKILGYFRDRQEDEILIDPRRIRFEALNWAEDQLNEAAERVTQRNHADAKEWLNKVAEAKRIDASHQ
jgi:hypothetical protein